MGEEKEDSISIWYLKFLKFLSGLMECNKIGFGVFALSLYILKPVVQYEVIVMELLP